MVPRLSPTLRRAAQHPARRRGVAALVATGVAVAVLLPASPAAAAGDPSTRVPGTPVSPVGQLDQSSSGGTNPKVGTVASTSRIGVPNTGVVPVVGKVTAKADDGAYVLYESRVDSRNVDLMVYSPALKGYAPVRVQLPSSWNRTPQATYPTLYLLHGGNEKADYQSWSLYSTEFATTRSAQALVVMPSTGYSGYATNWWNWGLGALAGKQYDTFVATEIPQLLQRGYRANSRAAIAGMSSGGNSALSTAMLHPGEYGAAASYSGLDDTQLPIVAQTIQYGPVLQFKAPAQMWGDAFVNLWVWDSRNPAAHADRLRGTAVYVSAGNGQVGPLDPAGAGSDFLEPTTQTASQSFVGKARAAGVNVTTDFYGNGTHSWPYWGRALQRSWPVLAAGLGLAVGHGLAAGTGLAAGQGLAP